jgi:hypothetical protein
MIRCYRTHLSLCAAGLENDGLVSVESSKWGEYLETLDIDHAAMINWSYQYVAPDATIRLFQLLSF